MSLKSLRDHLQTLATRMCLTASRPQEGIWSQNANCIVMPVGLPYVHAPRPPIHKPDCSLATVCKSELICLPFRDKMRDKKMCVQFGNNYKKLHTFTIAMIPFFFPLRRYSVWPSHQTKVPTTGLITSTDIFDYLHFCLCRPSLLKLQLSKETASHLLVQRRSSIRH